jgi:hypothetical protein
MPRPEETVKGPWTRGGAAWLLALVLLPGCDLVGLPGGCPDFELEAQGLQEPIQALVISDGAVIALTGDSTLFLRSPDGSWRSIGPPDRKVSRVAAGPGLVLALVLDGAWSHGAPARILASDDGGVSWEPRGTLQEIPLESPRPGLSLSRHAPGNVLFHQQRPGENHYSRDGGHTWERIRLISETLGSVRSAVATRDGLAAAGYRGHRGPGGSAIFPVPDLEEVVQYSVDGAVSLARAEIRGRHTPAPFLEIREDASDPAALWARDGRGGLFQSADAGRSWSLAFRIERDVRVSAFDISQGVATVAGDALSRDFTMPTVGGPPPPLVLQRRFPVLAVCSQTFPDLSGGSALIRDGEGNLILGTAQGVFRVR